MSLFKPSKTRYGIFAGVIVVLLLAVFLLGRGQVSSTSFQVVGNEAQVYYYDESEPEFLKEHERVFAAFTPEIDEEEYGVKRSEPVSDVQMSKLPDADAHDPMSKKDGYKSLQTEVSLPVAVQDEDVKQYAAVPLPEYKQEPPRVVKGAVKVAIIIDDMGMSHKWSQAAIDMDVPLTLAFLPYAENLDVYTKDAKAKGHELMVHTPMEPLNPDLDMGPIALRTGMDEAEFKDILDNKALTAFDGYVGINNHMGSKLTQDREAMGWVMEELKKRGLYFVDSKTINTSVAADMAALYGVPFATRDVFLDHVDDHDQVLKQLDLLEKDARRKGYAVAIGHPKENTITALKEWLPGALERGVEVVPVSTLLTNMQEKRVADKSPAETSN